MFHDETFGRKDNLGFRFVEDKDSLNEVELLDLFSHFFGVDEDKALGYIRGREYVVEGKKKNN